MAKLTCISGKAALSDWKPRLYFTCHPDDFSGFFQPICDLISGCRACDIYYNELSEDPMTSAERQSLLGNMNLFIVPVTMKLLSKPCAAMDKDIPFAQKQHIPILPILVESGLKPAFTLPHKFGDLPFLDATTSYEDHLPFPDQLCLHLDHLLVGESTAVLVETLHASGKASAKDPFSAGIACLFGINQDIDGTEALKLMTRAADDSNPRAMEYLYRMYDRGIGVPADLPSAMHWAARLSSYHRQQEKLTHWPLRLGYLSNLSLTYQRFGESKFSLTLATKLYKLSRDTFGEAHWQTGLYARQLADLCCKERDFEHLLHLRKRLYRICVEQNGKTDPTTLLEAYKLAQAHRSAGDGEKCMELLAEIFSSYTEQQKEGDPLAMTALYYTAVQCNTIGQREKALELVEKCYRLRIGHLGRSHVDTIRTLLLKAAILSNLGQSEESLFVKQRAHNRFRRLLGPQHPDTLHAQTLLALGYNTTKQYRHALRHMEQAYETYRDFYGPDFVQTKLTKNMYERIKQNADENQ